MGSITGNPIFFMTGVQSDPVQKLTFCTKVIFLSQVPCFNLSRDCGFFFLPSA